MTIEFNSKEHQDAHFSFCSLIKRNNGFFKSQAQSSFITSGKLIKGKFANEEIDMSMISIAQFNIPLKEGQDIYPVIGYTTWASYGHKSTQPVQWMYVIDKDGIVAQYKLHFKDNQVNPFATEKLWERTSTDLPNFIAFAEIQKEKELTAKELNAHTSFVGNLKDRIEFTGIIKSIQDLGYGASYSGFYAECVEKFKTEIITDDGNTIIYWGKMKGTEVMQKVKFVATVKAHNMYKEVKQTVVNRPKLLESYHENI